MQIDLAAQVAAIRKEWRTCPCGCKRSFKVACTSAQVFASLPCSGVSLTNWSESGLDATKRAKKGVNRMEASKERQRKHELPDGMISSTEVAARLGVQPPVIYNAVAAGHLPGKKLGPRKMGFVWEETKPAWEKYLATKGQRRSRERQEAALAPADLEHALFKPNTKIDGRNAAPAEAIEVVRHAPGPKYPEPIRPMLSLPGEPDLFQNACALAKPFVDRARRLEAQGKHAGAREFLWYALESLGFKGKANQ